MYFLFDCIFVNVMSNFVQEHDISGVKSKKETLCQELLTEFRRTAPYIEVRLDCAAVFQADSDT